ncbi:MAG: hypothetical protein GPJ54_20050 [Candidatus Heimdallarchaeota archaeon]|nr:hypothetical protein [Candidatus Heimdallarchaeota archaeon]
MRKSYKEILRLRITSTMLSRNRAKADTQETTEKKPNVKFIGMSSSLEPWLKLAKERIFSLAVGLRAGAIAPKIMEVGFSKVLYGADYLGVDIEKSNPFILFAPDGTVTYNPERIKRGFTYGAYIDFDFGKMIATNNSLPNGCGFSMYEIEDPQPDVDLVNYLQKSQQRIGQDQLSQLGKGNHFAGAYHVIDPNTGEDTHRRWVVVHCSGHVGGNLLYYPKTWLSDEDGFHEVDTAHGNVIFLEGEAKNRYLKQYAETNEANAANRDITVSEIFDDGGWTKLEEITHQGLIDQGKKHIIGAQQHAGVMPIAFNPEEGLVAVKHKPNLSPEFIESWSEGKRIRNLGLTNKITKINMTPHGGGYEFRQPLNSLDVHLDKEGISKFQIKFKNTNKHVTFSSYREIRDHMTYRRRTPIMERVNFANLAEIVFELPPLMQIYPLKSIPGGSH